MRHRPRIQDDNARDLTLLRDTTARRQPQPSRQKPEVQKPRSSEARSQKAQKSTDGGLVAVEGRQHRAESTRETEREGKEGGSGNETLRRGSQL